MRWPAYITRQAKDKISSRPLSEKLTLIWALALDLLCHDITRGNPHRSNYTLVRQMYNLTTLSNATSLIGLQIV